MTKPPGDSLEREQQPAVAPLGETLAEGLRALLQRIEEELEYNATKAASPYGMGMRDGLLFAQEAVVTLLEAHADGGRPQGSA